MAPPLKTLDMPRRLPLLVASSADPLSGVHAPVMGDEAVQQVRHGRSRRGLGYVASSFALAGCLAVFAARLGTSPDANSPDPHCAVAPTCDQTPHDSLSSAAQRCCWMLLNERAGGRVDLQNIRIVQHGADWPGAQGRALSPPTTMAEFRRLIQTQVCEGLCDPAAEMTLNEDVPFHGRRCSCLSILHANRSASAPRLIQIFVIETSGQPLALQWSGAVDASTANPPLGEWTVQDEIARRPDEIR